MAVMSVATYGFTMVAARILGPGSYGALVAMMNTLLVVSVLQLGLQATAARRIADTPEHVAQIEATILRVTLRAALLLGLLMLLLAPLIDRVLRLDSLPTAAVMALTAVPMTLMGGQAGILQGERRWAALSVLYLANGVPRLVIGCALMAWRPDELTAIVGVALGQVAPVLVGWWALRDRRHPELHHEDHRIGALVRETVHNSQALLAFFALSNVDVVVARNVLPEHQAGLYAGGLILTKAVLFLPQFVVVVAFPTMSTAAERRRALTRSLAAVALLGLGATLGALVLPGLAMVFVGGPEYAAIESRLWLFAVLGTLLSMLQLLVYAVIARQGRRSVVLVWGALGALVAGGLMASGVTQLLLVVVVVDTLLFVALLGISLVLVRHPVPETSAVTAAAN